MAADTKQQPRDFYYHFDLLDRKGNPSFSKVMSFFVICVLMIGEIVFGTYESQRSDGMTNGFLLYTMLLCSLPFGMNGLKTIVGAKFGGLAEAQKAAEEKRAEVIKAKSEEIKARRDLGAEDHTEPV